MIKKVSLKDAVGTTLSHDITEIRPGEFKGRAFAKGHTVCDEDICHLQKLGKNHLYMMEDLDEGQIHENDAAEILARALAGPGLRLDPEPKEGKIGMYAAHDGLLKINTASLAAFNMVDEVMCATLHNHTRVKQGRLVAATRAIPLVMDRVAIQRAAGIAGQEGPVVSVLELARPKTGLVITGNEVYHGLIQDRFEPVLRQKAAEYDLEVAGVSFAPDDPEQIKGAISGHLEAGCGLIFLSGGMSVDPDDVTRQGIELAGAREMHYGSAVLPGAMFLAAYLDDAVLLGIPACGMYFKRTVLDLVLPRILAGEKVAKAELALLGHGGLCLECAQCSYPVCPFGKG